MAYKLELEHIPFSLRDCVGKTGQTLSLRAAEQGLELACRVAPDIPDRLIGDPGRLRQILINLIGNAIKFTEQGEVFVDAIRDPDAPSAPGTLALRFSVRDTGIGIPKEKQSSVLEAFTQADSSTTRRYGGTGLGLTISSQLAELMGGRLWLESEVGVGTTFFFTVRFGVAPSQCIEQTGAITTLTGLQVLVVDDNATNRRILEEILSAWGFRAVSVPSGQAALKEIHAAAEKGTPYRLAILDCMMPEMDGFGLAERIRAEFRPQEMRLIILSSAARVGDAERCERVGIARYLTKPVIQSELLDAILQVMGDGQSTPPISPAADMVACPPMKILLAEDGLANKLVAKGLLEAAGHEVVIASDGREAIELWEQEPFDLILMDMHMPEVDGIQATVEIRRREARSGRPPIPIVAITAAAMPEDTRACLQAGMDAFIAKPLQPAKLYATLAEFASKLASHSGAPANAKSKTAPKAVVVARDPAPPAVNHSFSTDILNVEEALLRIPGGAKGLAKLCEVFHVECEQILTALADAIERGDVDEIRRVSHTMKGSAKLFSAARVSAVAFEIEQTAKAGNLHETPRLYGILRSEVAELRAALDLHLGAPD
ncbi:MAG: response regulator [Planctomycetaceae bacterium]